MIAGFTFTAGPSVSTMAHLVHVELCVRGRECETEDRSAIRTPANKESIGNQKEGEREDEVVVVVGESGLRRVRGDDGR